MKKEEDIRVKEKEEKLIMHAYSIRGILIMSAHLCLYQQHKVEIISLLIL